MTAALKRMIFAGCKQLGLDDETRRDLQLRATGKASLSEMTARELTLVVDALKANGFAAQTPSGSRRKPASRADLRLVHVMWRALGEAGKLERPDRAGLNAFIRSRFEARWGSVPADVDMLRDWKQIDALIQALGDWIRREGVPFDWGRVKR